MIYLYGLLAAKEVETRELTLGVGIDGQHVLYLMRYRELYAVVCNVDAEAFSQARLEQVSQDPQWVQDKAQHHHERIAALQCTCTVLPMSFCSIFVNEDRLLQTLAADYELFIRLLQQLEGMQEWNLKMYCQKAIVRQRVSVEHAALQALQQEMAHLPAGRQFFCKKKWEQLVNEATEEAIMQVCCDVQQMLESIAAQFHLKNNWPQAVTGRAEEMVHNEVFLLAERDAERFVQAVRAAGATHEQNGWIIECSGPWPPYHFVKLAEEGSMQR